MAWLRRFLGNMIVRLILRFGFLNIRHCTVYGDPGKVVLGKKVNLNNAFFNTASGRIIVGDNVFFGHFVMLITGTHDLSKVGINRMKSWPKSGRDIVIENGVMIGSGAIILGKVRIGKNAVVGAGSLVNRDVEPNTLVAGVPARVIRKIANKQHVQSKKVMPETCTG